MQHQELATGGQAGPLRRLWASRKSFRGFGILLFYCHMLMLFSALLRMGFADLPDLQFLLRLSSWLVPAIFTITTVSLFLPAFFWLGTALGLMHLPVAGAALIQALPQPYVWLSGLVGLLVLLLIGIRIRFRYGKRLSKSCKA